MGHDFLIESNEVHQRIELYCKFVKDNWSTAFLKKIEEESGKDIIDNLKLTE